MFLRKSVGAFTSGILSLAARLRLHIDPYTKLQNSISLGFFLRGSTEIVITEAKR